MISCSRRLQFCAGHRVWKHESKCSYLHGHNYVAVIHATASTLDNLGRVIDFSVLKESIGRWLEDNWDHGFLLFREDKEASTVLSLIPGQKIFYLDSNPTAENMANYLLREVAPQLLQGTGVIVHRVDLWETENCCAVASLS
jgi:6-pyruvoyltetrahydropterin/6-carboxytetrahydropterin synthase